MMIRGEIRVVVPLSDGPIGRTEPIHFLVGTEWDTQVPLHQPHFSLGTTGTKSKSHQKIWNEVNSLAPFSLLPLATSRG